MRPVVFQIGSLVVRSYTLALDLSLLLAVGILAVRARRRIARVYLWLDGALLALILGVLGGRVGYVVAHWDYFQDRPDQILRVWSGGLSWHGALLGAVVGLAVGCAVRRLRFWRLADEVSLVAPLVAAGAWLGCLAAGCAYGREVQTAHWLVTDLPDLFGIWALRYNVQLMGIGLSLAVGFVLWALPGQLPAGAKSGLFLLLFASGLALLDTLRADTVPIWGACRVDVLLDLAFAASGALVLGATYVRGGDR